MRKMWEKWGKAEWVARGGRLLQARQATQPNRTSPSQLANN